MLCQVSAQKGRAERKKEERLARREILDCRRSQVSMFDVERRECRGLKGRKCAEVAYL
jgi:hypothetical protein